MMENETPRTRSLLRQAARNAESGKIVAAETLYRQIIEETPESTAAWLGLAELMQDTDEKKAVYEHLLELDEGNKQALDGLAVLRGEPGAVKKLATAGEVEEEEAFLKSQEAVIQDEHKTASVTANPDGNVQRVEVPAAALAHSKADPVRSTITRMIMLWLLTRMQNYFATATPIAVPLCAAINATSPFAVHAPLKPRLAIYAQTASVRQKMRFSIPSQQTTCWRRWLRCP